MNEFGRTSLLRLAASVGSDDHWVMAASSGAITLTPLRMMSGDECQSATDRSVLLRLTDLGYVGGISDGFAAPPTSPLSNSVGVLLLPWSLQATLARLDLIARTSTDPIPGRYAPEDWLVTEHLFVDDAAWSPRTGIDNFSFVANTRFGAPVAGRRHFIFASLADERQGLDVASTRSTRSDGAAEPAVTDERGAVDPLTYTNPGSAPEGLSPLFVRQDGRSR